MAAGGFNRNVRFDGGDRLRFRREEDLVRADGTGDLQRFRIHVHRHDPGGAGPLEHGNYKRTDRAAANHQRGLSRYVPGPGDGVPGDACGFRERGAAQRESGGQRPQHPGR